jgi:CRISPR/Cas system-associated exonuclease Cas4 (RecB family)
MVQSRVSSATAFLAQSSSTSALPAVAAATSAAGGTHAKVSFTPDLERRLLKTMADMRELVASQAEPGPRWIVPKCQACSFFQTCWE